MEQQRTNIFSAGVFKFELLVSRLGQDVEVLKEHLVICESEEKTDPIG